MIKFSVSAASRLRGDIRALHLSAGGASRAAVKESAIMADTKQKAASKPANKPAAKPADKPAPAKKK